MTLGLPADRPTVAVFGGSLGARRINRAVLDLADRWADRDDRSIYHVVGRRDWEERLRAGGGESTGEGSTPRGLALVRVAYEDRMELVYAAADVVVCRAGAMTVAELAVTGVPSILVPLPGAPGDHQTANARVLERAGAAVLLPDDRCDADALATALDGLLGQPDPARRHGGRRLGTGSPRRRRRRGRGGRGQRRSARCPRRSAGVVSPTGGGPLLGDRDAPARVHVVGIGGAGMSAIATVLHAMGHEVTGSDLKSSGVTDRLGQAGIGVTIGHAAANVGSADLVTVSSAIPDTNPEVVEARRRGHHRAVPGRVLGRHRLAATVRRRGRHPRQDHDGVDAGPDPGRGRAPAVVPHRWRRQRDRHQRGVGRGRVAGGRGRRERRHASSRWCPTSRWSPTSRPTTSTTTARSTPSDRPSRPS